jgi:hypothetical protein
MTIDTLAAFFKLHQIMWVVAALFIINLSITGIEIVLDLVTAKERRWKDTMANLAIFVAHQVIEKTAFASLGFVALLPFYYLTPISIPMTTWTWGRTTTTLLLDSASAWWKVFLSGRF